MWRGVFVVGSVQCSKDSQASLFDIQDAGAFLCAYSGPTKQGDPEGVRRGSARDPKGIRHQKGGSGLFQVCRRLCFKGDPPQQLNPFIILKRIHGGFDQARRCGGGVLWGASRIVAASPF